MAKYVLEYGDCEVSYREGCVCIGGICDYKTIEKRPLTKKTFESKKKLRSYLRFNFYTDRTRKGISWKNCFDINMLNRPEYYNHYLNDDMNKYYMITKK